MQGTAMVAALTVAACCVADAGWTQETTFSEVKTRFNRSATDRRLVDKDADLVLNDNTRRLTVRNDDRPLDIGYDAVRRVVFDVSTHMRGGALGSFMGGAIGAAISAKHVNDYWCFIEYEGADGAVHEYMLEIGENASPPVIERMQALFGERVSVATFDERADEIDKETLADLQSKHDVKVDEVHHPTPEALSDKALVVVVCPAPAARDAGKGNQVKLHANGRVVLVNKLGTYGFVHLDPGDYLLASQTGNASGFRMTLEAGREYYFLQDTFMGMMKSGTRLSRHSRELVMYELGGAYYSAWTRK